MLNRVPNTDLPELPSFDPDDLVPLSELSAEGFGWGGQFVKTPRDAIDALARQLDGSVVTDDLGRRCTDRDTARRLLSERAEGERQAREQQERRQAEMAERAAREPRRGGVPVPEGFEGEDAYTVLRAAEAGARRDELTVHRMPDPDEPREAGEFYQYGPPR